MLLLAHAAFPDQIEAATVDHGLRPESAAEAAMVARVCADRGIPHAVLPVTLAPGNVQDRARAARYAALEGWLTARGLGVLLTAHHMDDQAETLLMRLNRGSGVRGLAGVRSSTVVPGGQASLIRPLLGWRRAELAAVVAQCGIEAAADPSNHDRRFDRVRIRQALSEAEWLDAASVARSAALLAQAEDAIGWAVAREWAECVVVDRAGYAYAAHRTGLGPQSLIRLGVLERAAGELGCRLSPAEAARMAAALESGAPCNVGGMAARTVTRAGERLWLLARENPRQTG